MAQAPKALRLAPGGSIRPYHDRDEASYGYARVSTAKKHLDLQRDALKQAGWERVFADTASGVLGERPQLAKVLAVLWPGDTLVVWRLDRLGRSLRHLIETVNELRDRGVKFRSLQ